MGENEGDQYAPHQLFSRGVAYARESQRLDLPSTVCTNACAQSSTKPVRDVEPVQLVRCMLQASEARRPFDEAGVIQRSRGVKQHSRPVCWFQGHDYGLGLNFTTEFGSVSRIHLGPSVGLENLVSFNVAEADVIGLQSCPALGL